MWIPRWMDRTCFSKSIVSLAPGAPPPWRDIFITSWCNKLSSWWFHLWQQYLLLILWNEYLLFWRKARKCDHKCKLINKIQCWKMESVLEKNALKLLVYLAPGGQAYHGAVTCFFLILASSLHPQHESNYFDRFLWCSGPVRYLSMSEFGGAAHPLGRACHSVGGPVP